MTASLQNYSKALMFQIGKKKMFNLIERTVLPKEMVEHADKEFLCF